jgi:hypothetical protein
MKAAFAVLSTTLSIIMCGLMLFSPSPKVQPVAFVRQPIKNQVEMPVLPDHRLNYLASNTAPIEDRGAEFIRYLAPSLRIEVQGGSGSGTIVYFNPEDGYAYMQSCGHLWTGEMTAEEGRRKNVTCTVTTWYKNSIKLDKPQSYKAEVLWYAFVRGRDSSLLRFKPDWQPDYFPIAPADYPITKDMKLHSLGCDGGREVAHYEVTVIGEDPAQEVRFSGPNLVMMETAYNDLVTKDNSPRPGRSGGGLLTTDGYYVAICWGTTNIRGNGLGLFTPLSTVRMMNEKNGYGWLNEVGSSPARKIPIFDRNGQQRDYPKDYIPLPNGR